MHVIDHILVLLLFVVLPIYSFVDTRRYLARVEGGEPANQISFYLHTMVMQWAFMAALGIAWWFLGRPIQDLGFRPMEGIALWGGTAVLLTMIVMLVVSWQAIERSSQETKRKQVEGLGKLVHIVPQSSRDFRYYAGVSITAGIVEEIVYRGFLIWYMGLFMPLWAAVCVSSVSFGLAHSYQGAMAIRSSILGPHVRYLLRPYRIYRIAHTCSRGAGYFAGAYDSRASSET